MEYVAWHDTTQSRRAHTGEPSVIGRTAACRCRDVTPGSTVRGGGEEAFRKEKKTCLRRQSEVERREESTGECHKRIQVLGLDRWGGWSIANIDDVSFHTCVTLYEGHQVMDPEPGLYWIREYTFGRGGPFRQSILRTLDAWGDVSIRASRCTCVAYRCAQTLLRTRPTHTHDTHAWVRLMSAAARRTTRGQSGCPRQRW